jgi:hypothetical protein
VISAKTVSSGGSTQVINEQFTYPLQVSLAVGTVASGDEAETVVVNQGYQASQSSPSSSTVMTQTFNGADTVDLVTGLDLLQNSSMLSTNTVGQTCLQVLLEAHDGTVVSDKSGPCTQQ